MAVQLLNKSQIYFICQVLVRPLVENVDHIPHLDVLTASITMPFGNIPPIFQRFYEFAYNNEGNERLLQNITVQPLY